MGYIRPPQDLTCEVGLTIYEAARRAHYTSPGAVLAAEEGKTVGISLMETLERVYRKEIERLVERKAA